jgi:HlyD family secretion protein
MSTLWWKRIGLGLLALAILGGLVYALFPKAAEVDIAQITRGDMRVTVDEEGKTRIKEVYVVSAPISGKMLRNALHVGDDVTGGTTEVATMVPSAPPLLDLRTRSDLEAQVSAAEKAVRLAQSDLARAESEATMAELDLKRTADLARRGFAAERVLDRANTDAKVRRAAVASAKSAIQVRQDELRSARARLLGPDSPAASVMPVSIKAPATGRILRVPTESEAPIAQGTPLLEIGDPGNLEVVVDLLSADAVKVQVGAEVVIDGWGGTIPLHAKVRRIEPSGYTKVSALGIEEQRVRTILDLAEPSSQRPALGHEFRVFTRILVWRSGEALRVPLGALFREGDRWAVFKVVKGRAKLQLIDLGHRNTDHAEVISGLAETDSVVLHPSDRVTDGVRVTLRK